MRICIIGYGKIAIKHIEVFRALGCEIVASCNRSDEKNLLAKEESNIPNTYKNYHQMIEETQPDGIILCVSFWNIYQVAKDLIPYQIPLLIEKPTGTSIEEHLGLIELCEKYRTPVQVGLNRRHYSNLRQALDQINKEDKLIAVLIEWSENPQAFLNKGVAVENVRKLIFANSIHGLDMMSFIAGPMKSPDINTKNDSDFKWSMNLSGISERGVICNFYSSWTSPFPWRLVLFSEHRQYEFKPLEKCMVTNFIDNTTMELRPDDCDIMYKPGFYMQAKNFITNYKNGYKNICEISSVTESMRLAELITNQF